MVVNISEQTVKVIQQLVHDAFDVNATLDRVKTILATDLAFPVTSGLVHDLAHKYARDIADGIGDLIETYNEPVEYGDIIKHVEKYATPQEAIDKVRDVAIDYQNELNQAAKIAYDNMDLHVFEGLMRIIGEHNKYVEQAIQWKDVADRYGSHPSLDVHMEHYDTLLGDDDAYLE